jgi:hypothetical protein
MKIAAPFFIYAPPPVKTPAGLAAWFARAQLKVETT